MKKKIKIIIECLFILVISYLAWKYDYPWARAVVCLILSIIAIWCSILTLFVNKDKQALKTLLYEIEKDLVNKATLSSENVRKLENFRGIFGLRLRNSLFSIFKKN
jgi:hypothetical protein